MMRKKGMSNKIKTIAWKVILSIGRAISSVISLKRIVFVSQFLLTVIKPTGLNPALTKLIDH